MSQTTPLSNDTLALLNSYEAVADAKPNDGSYQPSYPQNGIHTLQLLDVVLDGPNDKTTFGSKDNNVPGFRLAFVWQLVPEPGSELSPSSFYGQRFKLPIPAARAAACALPSEKEGGWQKFIEYTEGTLSNHVQVLLGRPASRSLGSDVAEISTRLSRGKILVRARCRTTISKKTDKNGNPYTNFEEHLQELLTA